MTETPSMQLTVVGEVACAYSNNDRAPYGPLAAAIHADLAKPFAERSMAIRGVEHQPDFYLQWKCNPGKEA